MCACVSTRIYVRLAYIYYIYLYWYPRVSFAYPCPEIPVFSVGDATYIIVHVCVRYVFTRTRVTDTKGAASAEKKLMSRNEKIY